MPRLYTVAFETISQASVLTLFQINGAAGKMLRIMRGVVSATDTSIPTSQMIAIRSRFVPATVTNGSGGSSTTPAPVDPGDAAASFTARTNDTTRATSTSTIVTQYETGFHVFNGWDERFAEEREQFPIGPSEAWCLDLLSTVSGTVHFSGTLWVQETGG